MKNISLILLFLALSFLGGCATPDASQSPSTAHIYSDGSTDQKTEAAEAKEKENKDSVTGSSALDDFCSVVGKISVAILQVIGH